MDNNSLDIRCLTHPNHIVIPITDGTYQCTGCLSNDVCRDLELANQERAMPEWKETIIARCVDDESAFEANRDAFAAALAASQWFKDSEEYGDVWQAWDEIKDAETVERFDQCLAAIYDMADSDRIWITFVHAEAA